MGKIKTTINVDDIIWKKFSIWVIKEEGYRKKSDVVEELIREYVDRREGEER